MESLQTLSFKRLLDLYHLDKDALISIKEKINDMLLNFESNKWRTHYLSHDVNGEFDDKIRKSYMSYVSDSIMVGGYVQTSYQLTVKCDNVKYRISNGKLYIKHNGTRWKIPYVHDEIKSYYKIPIDVVRYGAFLWKHYERLNN